MTAKRQMHYNLICDMIQNIKMSKYKNMKIQKNKTYKNIKYNIIS